MNWRRFSRCRRCAELVLMVAIACLGCGRNDTVSARHDAGVASSPESDASTAGRALAKRWQRRYYEGHLAETLRGDLVAARAAYEEVIAGAGASEPRLAARAALRLAEIEAVKGQRRRAIELVARASSLGRGDAEIVRQADELQTRLASLRSRGSGVRGPPAGATLDGVTGDTAARFRKAERMLVAYHKTRLQPRIEALEAGVQAKERAMELAVKAYRAVVGSGDALATSAAEFRIGSLYHDLGIALMFDLPPELAPRAAARLRRRMRQRALGYLAKARAAYGRSKAVLAAGASNPALERWRGAARRGLASVDDLLRGR